MEKKKDNFEYSLIFTLKTWISFKSEALGLLANLGERCAPTDWNSLIIKRPLLSWINDHLQLGVSLKF